VALVAALSATGSRTAPLVRVRHHGVMRDGWSGVELRHLAALTAIERTGSFRGAADELGYVQSAVSQQIARLEAIVGTRLVARERGRSDVSLTPAGSMLVEHADAIIARLAAAKHQLERVAESDGGILRVGGCETAATHVLPRLLAVLGQRNPHRRVVTREPMSWQDTRRLVLEGELDLALDYLPLDGDGLDHAELMTGRPVLVVQADSPLRRQGQPPTLEQLAALPLVEHTGWRFTPRLAVILEANGRAPRFSARSHLNGAVQSLVAAGLGAAVLPCMAIDRGRDDIATIDLSEILPPARLAAFWRADWRPPGLDDFLRVARSIGAELVGSCPVPDCLAA